MNSRIVLAVIVGLVAGGAACWAYETYVRSNETDTSDPENYPLDDLIKDIKAELVELEKNPDPRLALPLASIDIELSVGEGRAAGGQLSLGVPIFKAATIEASAEEALTQSSKVKITLEPPAPAATSAASAAGEPKPEIKFASLLTAVRDALIRAQTSEPKLTARGIEVELTFVLVRKATGAGGIEVQLLKVSGDAQHSTTLGNVVTLKFEP